MLNAGASDWRAGPIFVAGSLVGHDISLLARFIHSSHDLVQAIDMLFKYCASLMLMHMLAQYSFTLIKARNAASKSWEERKEIHLCVYQHGKVAGLEAVGLGIRD